MLSVVSASFTCSGLGSNLFLMTAYTKTNLIARPKKRYKE
jgi:hypothetical protein